jgi:hypothetical protein
MIADKVRANLERQENELQNTIAARERLSPNQADKVQVRVRKKAGKDYVRASAKGYQDTIETYQAKYAGRKTPKVGKAQTQARGEGIGGEWQFEGVYGTRADASAVRRNYKSQGYFTRVTRLKDGGYNVWIKEGASVKSYKLKIGKGEKGLKGLRGIDSPVEGPGTNRWSSFGTLPEYKPPDFKLAQSGYKPLDYKPIDNAPMFKPTGFKTMDYKPISNEPYYKSGSNQTFFREYVPIGQFGVRTSSEPVKRKRKKSREPRLVV